MNKNPCKFSLNKANGDLGARLWTDPALIENSALEQIFNVMELPNLHSYLVVMPDVHAGYGATIGSVIPLMDAVIPNAVGVDIGCGMNAVLTSLKLGDVEPLLPQIHMKIKQRIPTGFRSRTPENLDDVLSYLRGDMTESVLMDSAFSEYYREDKTPVQQLGTLGGGNHFIELQKDEFDRIWIMIHSGSRNFGLTIANKFNKLAQIENPREDGLPHLDAGTTSFDEYVEMMQFAVRFAAENRNVMMCIMMNILREQLGDVRPLWKKDIAHNYAAEEEHFGDTVWVHRKGATSAKDGEEGIIPGSMGTHSFIVRGRGNPESLKSCSHGAGRLMSRKNAKKTLDIARFEGQMEGVYSETVDADHLDEAPDCYKDLDDVLEEQTDLVHITEKLIPILNIKG